METTFRFAGDTFPGFMKINGSPISCGLMRFSLL